MSKEINSESEQQYRYNITIDFLITQLQEFLNWYEINEYRITEDFNRLSPCTYNLYNLDAEIENIVGNQVIIFNDLEDELKKDSSRVLNTFNKVLAIDVIHEWKKNSNWKAFIKFKDGTITIERIGNY